MGRAARRRRQVVEARRTGADLTPASAPARPARPPAPEWHRKAFLIYTVALVVLGSVALSAAPPARQGLSAGAVYLVITLAALGYKVRAAGLASAARCGMWVAVVCAGFAVAMVLSQSLASPIAESVATGVGGGLLVVLSGRIVYPPPPPTRRPTGSGGGGGTGRTSSSSRS